MTDASRYDGMTLNERLAVADLINAYEAAAKARDRAKMVSILRKVGVRDPKWTVDTQLQNPERYDQ